MVFRILVCMVLSLAAFARADTSISGSYFAVIVRDVDVSTGWYRSVLGLEPGTRLTEPGRYDIVNLQGPGLHVELLELADAASRPAGFVHGPFKVGMLVDDLEGFVDGLPASLPRPQIIEDAQNGLALIQLRDPDGNVVQVMQRIDRISN